MLFFHAYLFIIYGVIHHIILIYWLVKGSDLFKSFLLLCKTLRLQLLLTRCHFLIQRLPSWQCLHWLFNVDLVAACKFSTLLPAGTQWHQIVVAMVIV